VAEVFDVTPAQVMLVDSHEDDLDAAADCGLQTAYVSRPMELGPGVRIQHGDLSRFTVAAQDFNELADRLTNGGPTKLPA
jgi:2-haloacid dehalogenase